MHDLTRRGSAAGWVAVLYAVTALALAAFGCDDSSGEGGESEDCRIAREDWGVKTQKLGEKCCAGSYGSCENTYDDCIQGYCPYCGAVCTESCARDSDCGGRYCRQGICKPAATCKTFCDEYCCCNYFQDPSDPTRCKQGSCSC
jgi:hypothetical protein